AQYRLRKAARPRGNMWAKGQYLPLRFVAKAPPTTPRHKRRSYISARLITSAGIQRCQQSGITSLSYSHRSSDRSILEKSNGHLSRQTDATVGRGKWRDVALMHRITASEKHGIRHPRAIEMGPFRASILS